jgi:hypothetical protein
VTGVAEAVADYERRLAEQAGMGVMPAWLAGRSHISSTHGRI